MLTVSSICKQFTAKLEKVQKRETEVANQCAGFAHRLRADAKKEDAKAATHKLEAQHASTAIANIKALFGAK